jgi:iron-sulfur cluster repair protein YtfE (RIC family)
MESEPGDETQPEDVRPDNPLFNELLWVHSMVRRDLAVVSRLAGAAAEGVDPVEIRAELAALKTNGPLWQLKVNCLHYCRFVHSHHRMEDVAIFPTLRRVNPDLNPVIDRLEADHRAVAILLDRVEQAAESLVEGNGQRQRDELVETLEALATTLLEHLAFEERSVAATLGRMRSWQG